MEKCYAMVYNVRRPNNKIAVLEPDEFIEGIYDSEIDAFVDPERMFRFPSANEVKTMSGIQNEYGFSDMTNLNNFFRSEKYFAFPVAKEIYEEDSEFETYSDSVKDRLLYCQNIDGKDTLCVLDGVVPIIGIDANIPLDIDSKLQKIR